MGSKKEKDQKKPTKNNVLADHKRVGKKFLPPFNYMMGPMRSTSYIRESLPELVWIDQLNWILGEERAADISVHLSKILPKLKPDETVWWACDSHFKILSNQEQAKLRSECEQSGILGDLKRALNDFVFSYPDSGLSCIFELAPVGLGSATYVSDFELRLDELLDKRSRMAVLMQAIPIYMGFVQDRLKVAPGLALADFPEVAKYPSTERSKAVGASICAAINMLIGQQTTDRGLSEWPKQFWNRGIKLRPIDFSYLDGGDASN